ncbi:hypothetical protein ACTMTI_05690 [Nonomuraea sp. H19]|jgi:hypothetical protein|uniref:hypothetical protein n=1 Tax=Nonomuraea sp. H19 TaxID=3452206 RepID=UPI003F88CE58
MLPGRVLDVGALVEIAVAKTNHSRSIAALCLYRGGGLCIPATALALVYSIVPLSTKIELFDLISSPAVHVDDLTEGKVPDIAEILDGSSDITAGHVVLCGRATQWPILTDRADILRNLDPGVLIDALPEQN